MFGAAARVTGRPSTPVVSRSGRLYPSSGLEAKTDALDPSGSWPRRQTSSLTLTNAFLPTSVEIAIGLTSLQPVGWRVAAKEVTELLPSRWTATTHVSENPSGSP